MRLQATPRYPVDRKETVEGGVATGLRLALIRKTKHISDSIRRSCPPIDARRLVKCYIDEDRECRGTRPRDQYYKG